MVEFLLELLVLFINSFIKSYAKFVAKYLFSKNKKTTFTPRQRNKGGKSQH